MPVIIDGYNLLRLIEKTSDQFASVTDVGMCHILDKYLKQTAQKGQIVFDGIGPPDKTGFDNLSTLEVIFSGTRLDADTVIEDKIKLNTAPRSLRVVSNDNRLKRAAKSRRAVPVNCELFWAEACKCLNKKRTASEPSEKRKGLNESETKQWLKFFDLHEE